MNETDYNSIYVDRFYEMDPQFEDLLFDGTDLKDGMVVLIDDYHVRADPSNVTNPHEIRRAREMNRWCTVENVTHGEGVKHCGCSSDLVSFVGVYGDGTKRKRTVNMSYAWIVKRDSIP